MQRLAGPKLVTAFAEAYPDAFFVEIGSNDGEQARPPAAGDPRAGWRGIMVEPVPYVFERLRAQLRRPRPGSRSRTPRSPTATGAALLPPAPGREDDAALPEWYDAIGSFSRETVLATPSEIPDIEARMVAAEVPA